MSSKREYPKKDQTKNAHDEYVEAREAEIKAKYLREEKEKNYINTCLVQYSNLKDRKKLIKYGKKLCYSTEKLKVIENHFTAWNMDDIDINIVEDVYELQVFIDERISGKSFSDRFFNIFHDDEGDDANGI